jgi:glycerol kinase
MESYIAALDLGTTSNRCIIFDRHARIVGLHQKEHRQIFPQPGWVEHDPMEIWLNAGEVIRVALANARIGGDRVAALGITNQRETTVVWDRRSGKPYGNAIVWQCTRSDDICRRLAAEGGQDRFRAKTGLPIATYFSGPKVRWILDEMPGVRQEAEAGRALFGTIDSWIIWWLTGGPQGGAHVSDVSNASRTLMMNLNTLSWDEEILEALKIPAAMLPMIVPSSDDRPWGYTRPDGPMGASVPVCGAVGDQQAALVGQTCFGPGEAKNTYGTGCFMLLNTGHTAVRSAHGLLTTVGYQLRGQPAVYCLEGAVAVAGALVQWLRDNLGLIDSSAQIEALAASVADNGGAYIVPAFSGLFAPYWRSDARGVIVGLTRYITKGHLARAVLEANAYQTLDVMEAMQKDAGVPLNNLKVDGGMVGNELLMQFQADILNVPVVRPKITETTSLGAAYTAGLAVGFWSGLEELKCNWAMDKTWQPRMAPGLRRKGIDAWRKAVQRTLNWVE